jgi:hypothetical protein
MKKKAEVASVRQPEQASQTEATPPATTQKPQPAQQPTQVALPGDELLPAL